MLFLNNSYRKEEPLYDNILNSKYTAEDYESNPILGFLILGFPEISFNKRGISMLEKMQGSTDVNREKLAQEIIEFYNERLWEIGVDYELLAEDFKENFKYWKNNTDWWSDYVHCKLNRLQF